MTLIRSTAELARALGVGDASIRRWRADPRWPFSRTAPWPSALLGAMQRWRENTLDNTSASTGDTYRVDKLLTVSGVRKFLTAQWGTLPAELDGDAMKWLCDALTAVLAVVVCARLGLGPSDPLPLGWTRSPLDAAELAEFCCGANGATAELLTTKFGTPAEWPACVRRL